MADKDRVEPTITDLPAPAAEAQEPKLTEPTIADVVEKVEALESAGATPNAFDGSEADKEYQTKIQALVAEAHARIEQNDKEAEELLAISQRAIKPEDGTPYDSYGEPLDLDVAADMRLAQIALQDEETAKKFFDKFVARVGQKNAPTIAPLAMGNVSLLLSPDNVKDVKEVAPQFFTEAYSQDLVDSGKSLLENAGFSQQIIDRLDASFLRYMGATQQHEAAFPVEGPGVGERLKEPGFKDKVIDALGNKNVQRSLKWAGLIASCATGGIVVKAGMSGAKFLAGKLVENDNVKAFAAKMEDRSISFVSEKFGLNEAKIRKGVERAKGSVESVFKNKWVGLATGVAVMGIAIGLGHIDAVHDIAKDVSGRFIELPYSVVSSLSDGHNSTLDFLGKHTIDGYETLTHVDAANVQPVPVEIAHPDIGATAEAAVAQAAAPLGVETPAVGGAAVEVTTPQVSGAREFSAARSGISSGIAPEVRFPEAVSPVPGTPDVAAVAPGVAVDPVEPVAAGVQSTAPVTDASVSAAPQAPDVVTPSGNAAHVVKAGDTVSHIARDELVARGLPATRENIYKFVDQIYDYNKDVIGADVNKIYPGQTISLAFEPQNLNLTHHASVAVSAPAPHALEVSASRVSDFGLHVDPRSVLGVSKDQLLAATGLEALNPVPRIEDSAQLAATLRVDPDTAVVSVPAPTRPIVPNLGFAGSSSVSEEADVTQAIKDFQNERSQVAAYEKRMPQRWHDLVAEEGPGKG